MNSRRAREWRPDPEPLRWPMRSILLPLTAAWAVALVFTAVVPALHSGERAWWPWCCVAGLVLGVLGHLYVRRGRGNAAHA